jgi:FtsP/CotA-like multicopper oxidase with cupredoxin domain
MADKRYALSHSARIVMLNRRQFLASVATIGGAAILSRAARPVLASGAGAPVTLQVGTRTIEVRSKAVKVFGIRQPDGTAGLYTNVASPFRVHLENESGEPTLIHWHGLKPPYQQDGVPDISAPPIPPGGSADYDFPLAFPGTFWMHSHQGLQEQRLMAAPLIIRDTMDDGAQEVVIMLHDFSFRTPEEIFAGLRKLTSSAGMKTRGTGAMSAKPMQGMDMGAAARQGTPGMDHGDMHGMAMGHEDASAGGKAMDLNDVAYDAFLANDRTLADPEVVRVERGGRVLLRIINGASASNFVVDLGQLKGDLVAVDGHPVQPVAGSRFPIAMAQRIDLRIQLPRAQQAHPVFAVLEGERKRTGVILAPAGAHVSKLAEAADKAAPALGLKLENALRATTPLIAKPADRNHRIELTGSMDAYDWGINGLPYGNDTPMPVRNGERLEIIMTNKTMMSHPMHLHGHFFQVLAINGKRFSGAVRDTVLVPPVTSVTIAFDADNPGRWAFHCHNLYHMQSGMMTTVQYEGA